ncbi:hypothetical protein [Candidatus Nitrosotenuis sp. DW1]|uniref:hypothetical protein n=1 Tax=Candidatus Nitrosotenuis sp. DW1 TaxID=2259672 RepID=UPI0015C92F13|nr:hypothetical protein [Candidatus Nitrosotenuis sp. DW1]QLH08756.1 hypothetical protein DSQ19_04010 [Candidatus Nitrosotenuis sp. DW1]
MAVLLVLVNTSAYGLLPNTIGEIHWNQINYPVNKTAIIQVVDSDMNKISNSKDRVNVFVFSDSYPEGLTLTLYETSLNSGVFEKMIALHNKRSAPNILYTQDGDTITAKYVDATLPPPYKPTEKIEKNSTAFIGNTGPSLERAPVSSLRIQSLHGDLIKTPILVNQQIQLVADLENQMKWEQKFAYLVQIQDENGFTVSLSWLTGLLVPSQSFSPSQSWIPQNQGKYMATVFVWESIENPTALSPPVSIVIEVLE